MAGLGGSQIERAVSPGDTPPHYAWSSRSQLPEQLHHSGETDAGVEHLCAKGVAQLVRDDALGNPYSGDHVSPEITQPVDERVASSRAAKRILSAGERILGTQHKKTLGLAKGPVTLGGKVGLSKSGRQREHASRCRTWSPQANHLTSHSRLPWPPHFPNCQFSSNSPATFSSGTSDPSFTFTIA
jgi:hypothetical protein